VKEHLEMFCKFKGMPNKAIPDAVLTMIAELDLKDKSDYFSKDLSGG
jgi:ABC-type multidrug transport system ATPase subunit